MIPNMSGLRRASLMVLLVASLTIVDASIAQAQARNTTTMSETALANEYALLLSMLADATDIEPSLGRAERLLLVSAELSRRGVAEKPNEIGAVHSLLGVLYATRTIGNPLDNTEAGIRHSRAALNLLPRASRQWAIAQSNLAKNLVLHSPRDPVDDVEEAIAALKIALNSPLLPEADRGDALMDLGIAYENRAIGDRYDNLAASLAYYEDAFLQFAKLGSLQGASQVVLNMPNALLQLPGAGQTENIEFAIRITKNSIEGFQANRDVGRAADATYNLGRIYLVRREGNRADNIELARDSLTTALMMFLGQGDLDGVQRVQEAMADTLSARTRGDAAQNIDDAIETYRLILQNPLSGREPGQYTSVRRKLGVALVRRIRGDRKDNLNEAVREIGAALASLDRSTSPWFRLTVLKSLTNAEFARGNFQDVMNHAEQAMLVADSLAGNGLQAEQAMAVSESLGSVGPEAVFAAWRQGDVVRAWRFLNSFRARQMGAVLGLEGIDLNPTQRGELERTRRRIAELDKLQASASRAQKIAWIEQLSAARKSAAALVTAAGGLTPGSIETQLEIALKNADVVLAPVVTERGGVLLGARLVSGKLSTFAVAADQLTSDRLSEELANPRGTGWLDRYKAAGLAGASAAQKATWPNEVDRANERMQGLIGKATLAALEQSKTARGARVLLLLPGGLALLPVGLVRDERTGATLLDNYELTQTPSLAAFNRPAPGFATPSPLAVANPRGELRGGLEVASAAEGAVMTSWFHSGSPPLGRGAGLNTVLGRMPNATHWHLATHGFFDWDYPPHSALALGGTQRLTVADLAAAGTIGRPRLVFLSACETGLSYDPDHLEEFVGLPAAFLEAGAQSVVASLWRVPDVSVALLSMKFYELHIGRGLRPSAALRQAQLWQRDATASELYAYVNKQATEEGRMTQQQAAVLLADLALSKPTDRPYASPYYWAAFVALGN